MTRSMRSRRNPSSPEPGDPWARVASPLTGVVTLLSCNRLICPD